MKPLDPLRVPLTGTQLIEASAGTGKTYTITTLFLRLLLQRRLRVEQILVVTFTNAATAELRDRVRRRLREAAAAFESGSGGNDEQLSELVRASADREGDHRHLLEALRGLDQACIFTIHGFCQRMLQNHAFESGVRFELELTGEVRDLVREVVQDFWASRTYGASEPYVRHLASRDIKVDSLTVLAHLAVRWPDMPLVPDPPRAQPEAALEQYAAVQARAVAAWRAARSEVCEILETSPALSRSSYRQSSLPRWFESMDQLLSRSPADIDAMFDEFVRFTTGELVQRTKKGFQAPQHSFFDLCDEVQRAYQTVRSALDDWVLGFQHDLVAYARRELSRRKRRLGIQSFDDLLHQLARALRGNRGPALARRISEKCPAALIDEFQDTDPVQYEIFEKVYAQPGGALFLIGDPKQAIYAFRGADVFAYLRAARDAGENVWTLDVNYRSDPGLIKAVAALFSRSQAPFVFDGIGLPEVSPKPGATERLQFERGPRAALQLLFVSREGKTTRRDISKRWANLQLPDSVAAEISRVVSSGATIEGSPVQPGDVAVLTRTNRQAQLIQRALRALRVPSVLHGDASVLDSPEASEVALVLRALAEPGSASALRAALTTSILGLSARELLELGEDELRWERWVDRAYGWHELWQHSGFVPAFRRMLRDQQVPARLLSLTDGERRMTNLLHLMELLHQAAAAQHLGSAGLLRWFDEVRHDESAREELARDAAQIRLESDADAVQISTVHGSKGLEYPIVYCPFQWDGTLLREPDKRLLRFHDPDDELRLKMDLRPLDQKAREQRIAEQEALSESLRLLYVAATRAKHRCVVVCGAFNSYGTSSLGYLLHESGAAPDQQLAERSDEELRADLEQLCQAAAGSVQVSEFSEEPGPEYMAPAPAPEDLCCRPIRRQLDTRWRSSSFSSLAASQEQVSLPMAQGLDRDEQSVPSEVAAASAAELAAAVQPVVLHAFPRGATVGNLLHSILEHLDFRHQDESELRSAVDEALERYGFQPGLWSELLCTAFAQILEVQLDERDRICLRQIPTERRLNELEFTFPVAESPATQRAECLTARRLASVFQTRGRAPLPSIYAERVARLDFPPLQGFLRGFVDLVFEHAGRYYVVDYKSNYLGPKPSDYQPARLVEAMADHHYFLQYHLYSVALHRHLGLRLSEYDYEKHFGGVYYLFLRGMSPDYPPGHGVFFDRPPSELISGLSQVLAAPGGNGGSS